MSKLKPFFGAKELAFIEHINKELHQDIVREYCYYYAIIADYDESDVYGEKVTKTIAPPIKLYPRIMWGEPEQKIDQFGTDIQHSIEVYFHKQECDEKGVTPRAGDFINYSSKFFELTTVVSTKLPLGRPESAERIEYKCSAVQARKLQFDFPTPEPDSLTNQYSGSLDVSAAGKLGDASDRWANVPEDDEV